MDNHQFFFGWILKFYGHFFFKVRIDKPLFVQVGQKNDSYSNGSIPIKHRRLVGFYESSGGTSSFEATLGRTMFSLYGRGVLLSLVIGNYNYFTSSDPHHDMLGGGCQVRVVIENMMGRMENLKTLISGFLGLVILVRWALVTMFLS